MVSAEQRARVDTAVAAAEARTSAEIVVVVTPDSGRYDRAEDAFGFVVGLGFVVAVWFLYPLEHEVGSWAGPPPVLELVVLIVAMILGTGLGSTLAARVPGLRRVAIFPGQLREEAEAGARVAFFDQRLHHTSRSDAVLIYVSLFERTVVVLPDEQVAGALGTEAIAEVCEVVTDRMKRDELDVALVAGIEALGEKLAAALPGDGEDTDELPNALIVLDSGC